MFVALDALRVNGLFRRSRGRKRGLLRVPIGLEALAGLDLRDWLVLDCFWGNLMFSRLRCVPGRRKPSALGIVPGGRALVAPKPFLGDPWLWPGESMAFFGLDQGRPFWLDLRRFLGEIMRGDFGWDAQGFCAGETKDVCAGFCMRVFGRAFVRAGRIVTGMSSPRLAR